MCQAGLGEHLVFPVHRELLVGVEHQLDEVELVLRVQLGRVLGQQRRHVQRRRDRDLADLLPESKKRAYDVHPLVEAILDEAAKFAGGVLAPLNAVGDHAGAQWHDRAVTMPPGFKEAYAQFVDNGWNGLSGNPEHGGQGLPKLVSAAVQEMWKSANMAFSLCPLLTLGAVEALELCEAHDDRRGMAEALDRRLCERNMEYADKRESRRLGPVRLELLPDDTWQQWDRQRLARTGGTLEQYKHPCLIPDPGFRDSVRVEEELVGI